jgi:hypothetical protein
MSASPAASVEVGQQSRTRDGQKGAGEEVGNDFEQKGRFSFPQDVPLLVV